MEVFIVWVNFYSGEWETALGIYCIFFCVFTFAQIAKEKIYNSVFTTCRKRKRTNREFDNGSQKRERCLIYHHSPATELENTFTAVLARFLMQIYNTKYSVMQMHFLKTENTQNNARFKMLMTAQFVITVCEMCLLKKYKFW